MARYRVNEEAQTRAEELIASRLYVVRSEWSEVQPDAAAENAYLERHGWEAYPAGISASPKEPRTRPGQVCLRVRRLQADPSIRTDGVPIPGDTVGSQGDRAKPLTT